MQDASYLISGAADGLNERGVCKAAPTRRRYVVCQLPPEEREPVVCRLMGGTRSGLTVEDDDASSSVLFGQFFGGLTAAMFLFLIASGLSLVFGVMRVLNFAHGSFYMIGAYITWQCVQWLAPTPERFLACGACGGRWVALLGGYHRTLAVASSLWSRGTISAALHLCASTHPRRCRQGDLGHRQLSVSRPPSLTGGLQVSAPRYRYTISSSCCSVPAIAVLFWLVLKRSAAGRMVRAAALDREMLGALGANVGCDLYWHVRRRARSSRAFPVRWLLRSKASYRAWMSKSLSRRSSSSSSVGSARSGGRSRGSVIYGQVLSFGILVFPSFSIFSVFALMAVIFIIRPWGLFGRPMR